MGYIRHNAIIVTGHHDSNPLYNTTQKAHDKAVELGLLVTPIVQGKSNGYSSFLICPDGSKEGWDTSDEFDVKRAEWLKWIKTISIFINYVHISYGGDDAETVIVHEHD